VTFCAFSVGRTAPRAWVRVTCSTWRSCRGAPNHSNSHVTNDSWQSLTRVELLCCNSTTSCGPDGEGAKTTTTSCGGQESGPQKGLKPAPRPRQDPNFDSRQPFFCEENCWDRIFGVVDSPQQSNWVTRFGGHPRGNRFRSTRSTAAPRPLLATTTNNRSPTRRTSHGPGT